MRKHADSYQIEQPACLRMGAERYQAVRVSWDIVPGVYISYPFCAQKCTYCNFASGVFARDLEHEYVEALLSEISRCDWFWIPETIYLGGGTPSGMDPHDLARILSVIPGRPWREATIEAA